MADYDAERWLSRRLAWENMLDGLRARAGVPLPDQPRSTERAKPKKRARGDLRSPNKAA